MVDVPGDNPMTRPVAEPMTAEKVLLLVHVPPPTASLNVEVNPKQTFVLPVIADGTGLTITDVVTKHPPVSL
jgi:hypothetical protein